MESKKEFAQQLYEQYKGSSIDNSINSNYRFDGFNENLSLPVEHDFFKNVFCENHGIKLIRFKYSEAFKRDSILEKVHDIVELP